MFCEAATPRIMNNTIVGNIGDKGAGIYIDSLSSPILVGNIVANDSMPADGRAEGGGIYSESGTAIFLCNDVYGNEGGNYIGIPDQTGLNGNISADPVFCNARGDDYSLMGDSPCLAGCHPGGGACGLMGAFGVGCSPVATVPQDFPAKLALHQNHPNPFNPSTSISYYLPTKARVAVEIYDASGALVRRLINEEQESGAHAIAWNGLDDRGAHVASGVYFYRLKAGKQAISRKMILLR